MAMTITAYQQTGAILCGIGDWVNDSVKLALVTNAYTFNAAHTQWSQVSDSEVSNGDGYTTGGSGLTTSISNTALKSQSITFSAPTKTCRYAVIYFSETLNSIVNPVLWCILLDATPSDLVIDFTLTWSSQELCLIDTSGA